MKGKAWTAGMRAAAAYDPGHDRWPEERYPRRDAHWDVSEGYDYGDDYGEDDCMTSWAEGGSLERAERTRPAVARPAAARPAAARLAAPCKGGNLQGGKSVPQAAAEKGKSWGKSSSKSLNSAWPHTEPPAGWDKGKGKRKGYSDSSDSSDGSCTVLAVGLPRSPGQQESLWSYFAQFGEVMHVEVNPGSSAFARGSASIHFSCRAEAEAAVANEDGLLYEGRFLECRLAVPARAEEDGMQAEKGKHKGKGKKGWGKGADAELEEAKIFVGCLPLGTTEEELQQHFEANFGPVQELLLKRNFDTGEFRGFGFVTFKSIETARAVLENFEYNTFHGKWIDCKVAVEKGTSKGSGKKASKREDFSSFGDQSVELEPGRVFVSGLPKDCSEDEIKDSFESNFGEVKSVVICYEPSSGAHRGTAFVTFADTEMAKFCVENYDNNSFRGEWIEVKDSSDRGSFPKKRSLEESATVVAEGFVEGEEISEAALVQLFEYYGAIKEVHVEQGSATICFESPQTAALVLEKAGPHGPEPVQFGRNILQLRQVGSGEPLRKRHHGGAPGEETDKVFLQKVPKDLSEQVIVEHYSRFGVVKECALPFDTATGVLRGFGFMTFESPEAAARAAREGMLGEPRLDYGQRRGGKRAAEAPRPADVFLKITDLPSNPKQRDIFKLFYNYSVARIRDLDTEAVVEFCSIGECARAFSEKQGARCGPNRIILAGATREDFQSIKAAQEALGISGQHR
eukprot:TRINITY_DN23771_c0_g1_i1.p1 TRINITY_DN23771_c0_g1~~TRINITY_DN23771_c0_g1_i1.p1  ORF type:complete len:740 (-),score=187.87 TRINITY_DN23771_c0_g1_i1:42-2261(-)